MTRVKESKTPRPGLPGTTKLSVQRKKLPRDRKRRTDQTLVSPIHPPSDPSRRPFYPAPAFAHVGNNLSINLYIVPSNKISHLSPPLRLAR
jgi:hypothetical protein